MTRAYYNENDPKSAAWLRDLIKQGYIAKGEVDTRSIEDVAPRDLEGFSQCHFFAGIGGWSYALRLAGWKDDRPVWTGSCPCQPFSTAGKRKGTADARHLWPALLHLIQERRPSIVYGEQVASRDGLSWLDIVQADLESQNYACGAADICAAGVGAPHVRQRLYWVAHANGPGLERYAGNDGASRRKAAPGSIAQGGIPSQWADCAWLQCRDGKYRPVEPSTFPLAHGVPGRVGLVRGYGNAIVPQVAAVFIKAAMEYGARVA